MAANVEAGLLDKKWSDKYESLPLRIRYKLLRAGVSKPTSAVFADAFPSEERESACGDFFVDQGEECSRNAEVPLCGVRVNVGGEKGVDNVVSESVDRELLDVDESVAKGDEPSYEFDDELDDVVLGERRRMLVSRKYMQSSESCMMEDSLDCIAMQNSCCPKEETDAIQKKLLGENLLPLTDANELWESAPPERRVIVCCLPDGVRFEKRASSKYAEKCLFGAQGIPLNNDEPVASSVEVACVKVKDEVVDNSELCSEGKNAVQNLFSGAEMAAVKMEPGSSGYFEDQFDLDHLPLIDRVKLLSSGTSSVYMPDISEHSKEDMDFHADTLESAKINSLIRSRKRKRTATNSVQTALEEDAPGLLKVLVERGVLVDEIKLYGEAESADNLEDSVSEDGFSELEAVISQLFSQRQMSPMFPPLLTKGSKISYCLSCLLSLVEQTNYLRNRKWPVEWGWCRDLQSFIFVFPRHNRIVLERPEYGYATYFFELLDSVPISWQINRLVTVMKLTSCGRITLIENKPLKVGEDLDEVEARILAEYGWTPSTGLGTMLNYCDRVVHDRKQEMGSSEWRSKIGRQLMNGYNGGNIVPKSLPKKLIEYQESQLQDEQVKLEQY